MDWDRAIERNREALKRVVAALAAMAGLDSRGQFTFFPQRGVLSQDMAQAEKSKLSPAPVLPRHLHRAVLRLLRPAEAAARRLVIVFARGLTVEPPRQRPRKAHPNQKAAAHAALRSLGLAIVLPRNAPHPKVRSGAKLRRIARRLALPLFDPIRIPRLLSLSKGRPRYVPAHAAPRILSFDGARPHRLPPPPSPAPDDPIDATRLTLRLAALASALDDLPKHARRFARWKMRRDRIGSSPACGGGGPPKAVEGARNRSVRLSPLRPGRPPGLSAANRRRPAHEVHEILADMQYFAVSAMKQPDTS